MKKKIVSALMVAAMVVTAFAGCGSDKGGTSTQGGDKTSKSSGKVYMLNFKPETDEAWQNLAETYTDQTGVEVNVLTAADGQYSTAAPQDGIRLPELQPLPQQNGPAERHRGPHRRPEDAQSGG